MPCAMARPLPVVDPSLPPCWDAWGFKADSDDATPTTCVGSDDESTVGFCISERSSSTSESETDTAIGSKQKPCNKASAQFVPPPPGLEGCLCTLFPEGEKCGDCFASKKKDCNAAQIAIAQMLGLNKAGRRYSSI
jgi:hypothetical protein